MDLHHLLLAGLPAHFESYMPSHAVRSLWAMFAWLYMRRWLVERFFAWLQWQRRILIRWEYHTQNFLGFVQLACLIVLFKRF